MIREQDNSEYEIAAAAAFVEECAPSTQDEALQALGSGLMEEFRREESNRQMTEQRWLKDLRQYRGQYDPDVEAKLGPSRSKAFVRKTRVKVKTTDSRVMDLLFPTGAGNNWSIDHTPEPSVAPEQERAIAQQMIQQQLMQLQQQAAQAAQQAQEQGQDPTPILQQAEQMMAQMSQTPPPKEAIKELIKQMTREASKRMARVIEDQLVECRYKEVAKQAVHSGHLYGTGIIKGPLVEKRVRNRFVKEGNRWVAKSETYTVPFIDFVPVWRWYPDMSASELRACRYVYERHTMTQHEFSSLADRKSFSRWRGKIIDWINANPGGHGTPRYWDNELRTIGERNSTQGDVGGTYEVLERWGWLTGTQLRDAGVEVPEERLHEPFFSNVWLLPNGCVIKVALQAIDGTTWPYHLYYFDKDESSIFPEGLASIMRDDQEMLNAATRLMIDNAAITSGPQLEVSPHLLTKMEAIEEMSPWKIWLRNNVNPGQSAIREITLRSNVGELQGMAAMFENNADETTAIPRYMSGENATNGAAGTSSGLSMLMGAVNIVIKDLITAYDEGVTISFVKALYHWNMRFNQDDSIKGDYDVKATGSASLVAKEVRARQLNEFAAMTSNPLDSPWVKRGILNKLRAESNELVDVIKTQEEFDAEQNSPAAMAQMQHQQQLMVLQLQELSSKIHKSMADAQKTVASIELVKAQAVSTKVSAAYAGLQAGQVATRDPITAPAGDEILRSSGWVDATPDPSIAGLNKPPVQDEEGTSTRMGANEQFAEEPRGNTDPTSPMNEEGGEPQAAPSSPMPEPATGMVGMREGIETMRDDG